MSKSANRRKHFRIHRGDFRQLRIDIDIEDGQTLVGKPIYFTAKHGFSDSDEDAVIQKSLQTGIEIVDSEPPTGTILVDLLPDSTDDFPDSEVTLVWDVQIEIVGEGKPYTLDWGYLTIRPDVTRRTSQ